MMRITAFRTVVVIILLALVALGGWSLGTGERSVYADDDPVTQGTPPAASVTSDSGTRFTCDGLPANIVGSNGNDMIFPLGSSGPNVIVALGGDDFIIDLGGDDVICAGEGGDTVIALRGNNRIFGGGGMDAIMSGPGQDFLDGGPGIDICAGDGGRDTAVNCESTSGIP